MSTATLVFEAKGLMGLGRILRAYLQEARYELLQALRAPAFAFPFLLLPAPLYLFFGVVMAGSSPEVAANPELADYAFAGWCVMSVMGPALFGIGVGLALERDSGVLKLKRALPAPPGAHLIAKMLMSMAFAAFALATVTVAALVAGNITLSGGELATLLAAMIVGALPFCAIGLFIGAFTSGGASPAFANLVYLPSMWLSGIFFPLPAALRPWAVIWPTFHLDQVALGFAGRGTLLSPLLSTAVLVAVTVACGGLALRRVTRVG